MHGTLYCSVSLDSLVDAGSSDWGVSTHCHHQDQGGSYSEDKDGTWEYEFACLRPFPVGRYNEQLYV